MYPWTVTFWVVGAAKDKRTDVGAGGEKKEKKLVKEHPNSQRDEKAVNKKKCPHSFSSCQEYLRVLLKLLRFQRAEDLGCSSYAVYSHKTCKSLLHFGLCLCRCFCTLVPWGLSGILGLKRAERNGPDLLSLALLYPILLRMPGPNSKPVSANR